MEALKWETRGGRSTRLGRRGRQGMGRDGAESGDIRTAVNDFGCANHVLGEVGYARSESARKYIADELRRTTVHTHAN